MSYTGTLYEGDSLIHTMPLRTETPDERTGSGKVLKGLGRRFIAAWRAFFDWLDESCREARYRQIEAYLAESTDLADLERRQRNLDQNHRHFYC